MSEDKSKLKDFITDGDLDVGIVAWHAPNRDLVQDINATETSGSDEGGDSNSKKEEHIVVETYIKTPSVKNVEEQNVERPLKDKNKDKDQKAAEDKTKEQE